MPVIRGPPPVELIYAEKKDENIESQPIPQIPETVFSEEIATTPIEEKGEENKLHKELFSVSPIHGLGFIHSSKNPLEILFWYLLIIVFIGIMIKDICQLVKQYQVQPTTTQVKMNFNKTIKPPLMFLCIPIILPDIQALQFYENGTHFDGLSSVLNGLETKDQFLNSTDLSLFITMYQYLATFGMAENAYGNSHRDMSFFKNTQDPHERAVWNLEQKMISLNVTQEEIINKTGIELEKLLNIDVVYWVQLDGYGFAPASHYDHPLVFVDYGQSCFKLDLNKMKSAEEYIEISVNMSPLLRENDYMIRTVSILFDGQEFEPSITDLPKLYAETGTLMKSRIEITGLFTVLSDDKGKQRCSQIPKGHCCQDCRARFIYEKCACVPLFGRHIPWTKSKNICLLSLYSDCLQYAATDDQACFGACLPYCKTWTYRVDSTPVPSDSPFTSVFTIAFTNFVFPNFQEVYALSWQNFLGDCGGTLGLWLGASFLSIIHVIIVACKLVITKFKLQWQCKRKISTVPKQVQTVN